jgi:hypothetical protein
VGEGSAYILLLQKYCYITALTKGQSRFDVGSVIHQQCNPSFTTSTGCRKDAASYDVSTILVLVLDPFLFVLQYAVLQLRERARGRRRVRKTTFNCQHSFVGNYHTAGKKAPLLSLHFFPPVMLGEAF